MCEISKDQGPHTSQRPMVGLVDFDDPFLNGGDWISVFETHFVAQAAYFVQCRVFKL